MSQTNCSNGAQSTHYKILRLPAVISLTGCSRSTIYLKISEGKFPQPIALGKRAVGWLESDIHTWIQHQIEYANKQAEKWEEIAAYMDLMLNRNKRTITLANGDEISVPAGEAPAYLEWIIWRSFLALDKLVNQPYNARRFKVDQDFLPVSHAPGNGPDMIFEFKDCVIAVEVTLIDTSRQEAMEGEPVRRHIANLLLEHKTSTGKPVYGLFIAGKIDSNTAETFRIGIWYTKNDDKLLLKIIPLTLSQYQVLFLALCKSRKQDVDIVRRLLDSCSDIRTEHDAPSWKHEISNIISKSVSEIK